MRENFAKGTAAVFVGRAFEVQGAWYMGECRYSSDLQWTGLPGVVHFCHGPEGQGYCAIGFSGLCYG